MKNMPRGRKKYRVYYSETSSDEEYYGYAPKRRRRRRRKARAPPGDSSSSDEEVGAPYKTAPPKESSRKVVGAVRDFLTNNGFGRSARKLAREAGRYGFSPRKSGPSLAEVYKFYEENSTKSLSKYIDHTLLKPEAKPADIVKVCSEAKQYKFASVCANPVHVALLKKELGGSKVMVCCVVGFPLGASHTDVKAFETAKAVDEGADEIDMVMAIGHAKAGMWDYVEKDIAAVVQAAKGKTVKVIFETCLLTPDEIREASKRSERAGAHFIKTSTGFNKGGATLDAVKIMRSTASSKVRVKASGGIRDAAKTRQMIAAGATRIGASSGIKIVSGGVGASGY